MGDDAMRMDSVIYLISSTISKNDMSDPIKIPVKRETFAEKNSVRQSEFYQAAATGLKPELTFTVWCQEYASETELEYEGQTYKIIRTFSPNNEKTELICEGLVNGVT